MNNAQSTEEAEAAQNETVALETENETLQNENLSHYLLESGLAEIFGKDFYEKVQDDVLNYRNSQIREYECQR